MHDLASVRKVLAAAFEEENSNAPATREGEPRCIILCKEVVEDEAGRKEGRQLASDYAATGPPDTIYIPFDGRDNLAGRIRDRYVVAVAVVVSKPNSWSSRELTVNRLWA